MIKQEVCENHESHAAIEHCEECGDPLCGLCLWYTQAGRRLCERHAGAAEARGETVLPPETYEEAIPTSLRQSGSTAGARRPGLYVGNSNDLIAFLAAVASITTLLSCFGGAYCIPVVAGLAGAASLLNADKAEDPGRTRLFGALGLSALALMVLFIMVIVLFYALIFGMIALTSTAP